MKIHNGHIYVYDLFKDNAENRKELVVGIEYHGLKPQFVYVKCLWFGSKVENIYIAFLLIIILI